MAHLYSTWAHFLLVGLAGPDAKAHSGGGMLPTTNWCERSQVAGLLWLLVQRKFTFHAVLSSGTFESLESGAALFKGTTFTTQG